MEDDPRDEQPADQKRDGVPPWFDVLEGLSDEDLAEINAIIAQPIRLAHRSDDGTDGSALG